MASQPEFDRYAGNYSGDIGSQLEVFGQDHDFFVRSKAEILLSAFARLNHQTSRLNVLDVGCGVGLVHRYIVSEVGRLNGADVSGASIDLARKKNPGVAYESYDGNHLPYPDASFDCVYAICVLHHVPVSQWRSFVAEMRRVARPGGLVLIIEHNPLNPATQFVVRNAPMDENAVLVWPRRLRALMAAVGLGPLWTSYVMFTPFGNKWFRKLDRVLSPIPLGAQYVMGGRV